MRSADETHILGGSYALDALPPEETEAFERHLLHCATCAAEVRGLRETAARLGLARAVPPPATMRQRVLTAAYQIRQLPPRPAPVLRSRRLRRGPRPDGVQSPPRLVLLRRPAAVLAAAAVAAVLAFGVTEAVTHHQPGATMQTAQASTGGTVTLTVTSGRDAVLTADQMPALPDGRVYQVWLMSGTQAQPAGFLSGAALVLTSVRPGERVGVTIEPPGGTSRPTTTPIVSLPA
jgi:hypothetical protein